MTPFEVILLVLIYLFCYGYALRMLQSSNEDSADIVFRIIGSFIIAFYIPMIIGSQIANKLN